MLMVTRNLLVLKKRRFSLFFFLWLVLISSLSLISIDVDREEIGFLFVHFDKLVHFSFYFGFVLLASFSLKERKPSIIIKNSAPVVVVVAIVYGALMEFLQYSLTNHRSADLYDIMANSLGAIMAGLLIVKYHSLIPWLK